MNGFGSSMEKMEETVDELKAAEKQNSNSASRQSVIDVIEKTHSSGSSSPSSRIKGLKSVADERLSIKPGMVSRDVSTPPRTKFPRVMAKEDRPTWGFSGTFDDELDSINDMNLHPLSLEGTKFLADTKNDNNNNIQNNDKWQFSYFVAVACLFPWGG